VASLGLSARAEAAAADARSSPKLAAGDTGPGADAGVVSVTGLGLSTRAEAEAADAELAAGDTGPGADSSMARLPGFTLAAAAGVTGPWLLPLMSVGASRWSRTRAGAGARAAGAGPGRGAQMPPGSAGQGRPSGCPARQGGETAGSDF